MTKSNRLRLICDIIENHPITTQEELQQHLERHGFHVTQATVSRDMKELRLSKAMNTEGIYCYSLPHDNSSDEFVTKFRTIFRESVISFASTGNLMIVKCYTGMGNAACAALDAMNFPEVVGTIAGDDTIFAAIETPEKCVELISKLNGIMEV